MLQASYPRHVPGARRTNIILVIVDSLRADHMQVYGYERRTTPFLSQLVSSGRMKKVEMAFSTCSESFCGITSTLAGREFRDISARTFQLQDTLRDEGYQTWFLLSGSHKIQGFETELKGYVTTQWQTSLGYAYTDARITSNTSATVVAGNRVQLVPLHQYSWWNKYQFTPMWAASVGVIYFSESFASSDDTVKLPGFFRVDAGIFATINERWRAQLNVENVFNKGYWASADGNNNLSPGQPRTFRLSAIAKF